MQPKSTDFTSLFVDGNAVDDMYVSRLSYAKAFRELRREIPRPTPSGLRYAKALLFAESLGLAASMETLVATLRSSYDSEMMRAHLDSSAFGQDDSWIWWDIAKQIYFFVSIDRGGTSDRYVIENPLTSKRLQEQIVARHMGWELWYSTDRGKWGRKPEIKRLLGAAGHNTAGDGQPASWALEEIGARIRASI
ncbi:MAG: hypothetical protein KAV87_48380 [Desulfobacteraceae bacterium]|nr:hypothetical protein [Desulfobacteraceae bacterium]